MHIRYFPGFPVAQYRHKARSRLVRGNCSGFGSYAVRQLRNNRYRRSCLFHNGHALCMRLIPYKHAVQLTGLHLQEQWPVEQQQPQVPNRRIRIGLVYIL
jgi:hypothetical protein